MSFGYNFLGKLMYGNQSINSKMMYRTFNDRTLLITGASFGVGAMIAEKLKDIPMNIVLVARTKEKLDELKEELEKFNIKVYIYAIDLRIQEEMERFNLYLEEKGIQLDYIINNAGHSICRSILESIDRYHDFTRTMAINYHAPVQLILKHIPTIIKNKGHIVNVSTANVVLPPAPLWSAYQASKVAFDQWFQCVAPELRIKGVGISTVYLPLVNTRMVGNHQVYNKVPKMHPEHAANIIINSIVYNRRTYRPWWTYLMKWVSWLNRNFIEKIMMKVLLKMSPKRYH